MTVQRQVVFRRIVVAVDPDTGGEPAETAGALARSWRLEVEGIFVEDVNLVRWASLPDPRELGVYSGSPRPVTLQAVERALRSRSDRARQALLRALDTEASRLRFRTLRGAVAGKLLELLEESDLLAVGWGRPGRTGALGSTARALLREGRGPLLLVPPRFRPGGPVAVVIRPDGPGERLRRGAETLADAWNVQALALEGDPDARALARALREHRAGAVVLTRTDPLVQRLDGEFEEFLSQFRGAILVIPATA
jgi:nucleotide-binding universal stress UspA family protein